MKQYIIDGFNLIHKSSALKSKLSQGKNIAVAALIEIVRQYAADYPSYSFTIFIDGAKDCEVLKPAKVETIFSGKTLTADELIKQYVAKHHQAKLLTVVSSDVEVYNYARIHACEAIISEDFLKIIQKPKAINTAYKYAKSTKKEKPNSASRKNIEEFKRLFSEDL